MATNILQETFGGIFEGGGGNGIGGLGPAIQLMSGFIILIGLGLIFYFGFRQHFYPIQIVIRRRLGTGEIVIKDHGKIIQNEDGSRTLHIHGLKKREPLPSSSRLSPFRGGMFKKWYLELYQDANGEVNEGDLLVVKTDMEHYEAKFIPVEQDKQRWAQMERKRNLQRNMGDWWGKYGVLLGEGLMVIALIIVTFIIMNKHVEASEIMARSLRETATILQTLQGGS